MKKWIFSSAMAMLATVALMVAQEPAPQQEAPKEGVKGGGQGGFGKGGFGKGKAKAPAGPFTRLPDGHPDMQGYWNAANNGGAVFEVQNHPNAKRGVAPGKGAVVDPPDGFIPYQPWAKQKAAELFESHMDQEPELHCYQSGVPHQNFVQFGFQITQTPGYMVMAWEFMHAYRIIPTDGRPHIPEQIRLFQGDSVGHWEGDTLVIDTTNNNDKTWMDTSGNFKSDKVHIVERLTPRDANTIDYEATIEDPSMYTRPWKIAYNFARSLQPDYEQMEFGCIEGNQDVGHYTEDVGGPSKVVIRPPAGK
jgi:hypothetical protein